MCLDVFPHRAIFFHGLQDLLVRVRRVLRMQIFHFATVVGVYATTIAAILLGLIVWHMVSLPLNMQKNGQHPVV